MRLNIRLMLLVTVINITAINSFNAFANGPEEPNAIQAWRISEKPSIDGFLDDNAWKTVGTFYSGNFIQNEPNNGALSSQKTEIKIAYDDFNIYISAMLFDDEPDQILSEFGIRDSGDDRNSDMFAVAFDTYNKEQNAVAFMVSAAGVQTDLFITPNDDDTNWNAVWKSAVKIQDNGWSVEMSIPYSALRFAKQDEQTWGANFLRIIKRNQETSFWNHVDASVNGFVNQFGKINGLRNIEPPVRMQLMPYISGYLVNDVDGNWSSSLNGGADLKLGLNESFTLDMSLVPDFGQVVADNVVFNLSPFEVQFSENRQFFTEGTELFDRGGMFYSRRVGQSFASQDDVYRRYLNANAGATTENLEVIEMPDGGQPSVAPLINATKISGRTKKGLGIGFFNAMTNKTHALVRDYRFEKGDEGYETQVVADPFTNFNVFVLDQNLKNNSNIGIINTNVTRGDGGKDANATAVDFRINDKENKFGVRGFGAKNWIWGKEVDNQDWLSTGFKYYLEAGKYSGTWQYGVSKNVESDDYNIRDMGFLRAPNEITHRVWARYNIFKPKNENSKFLRFSANWGAIHEQLYEPRTFSRTNTWLSINGRLRNFWDLTLWQEYNGKAYDYFEPRTDDFSLFLIRPGSHAHNARLGTDSRKRFRWSMYAGFWRRPAWNQFDNWFGMSPRFRVNNKLSFEHNFEFTRIRREVGYAVLGANDNVGEFPVAFNPDERAPFGLRERKIVENTFSANYIFNNVMGLNLRVRHYWSNLWYDQEGYSFLKEDGTIEPMNNGYKGLDAEGNTIHDSNFNAFNVDLVYSWQFAPGSMMTLVWKRSIFNESAQTDVNFSDNLANTWNAAQTNSFSVRILYFVDYLDIKKLFRNRTMSADSRGLNHILRRRRG